MGRNYPSGGLEVDFLARRPAGGAELIQVCAGLTSEETRTRELRALMAAKEGRRGAPLRLLRPRHGTSNALVSPTLPKSPIELVYILTVFVTVSVTVIV